MEGHTGGAGAGGPRLLRSIETRSAIAAARRTHRYAHPGALALHLKHLRSSKFAGPGSCSEVSRSGDVRQRELWELQAGRTLRRERLSRDFLEDVLIAAPRDFGFFGEKEGTGRYAPWRNAENQAKFKTDLTRMIDLILAGKKDIVSKERSGVSASTPQLAELPKFSLTDLSGKPLTAEQAAGRVVLVEFWATWCPPCRSTLQWLGEVKKKYGDNVAVLALAVESPEDQVREMAGDRKSVV